MKMITLLSGGALLAVAGTMALAQDTPARRPDPTADVTRAQVEARVAERFARLDANHDGRFTPEEARAMGAERRAAHQARIFDRIDANHDGNVSREEFAQTGPPRGGMGRGRGRGHHRMGPPPGGPGGPGMPPSPGAERGPPPGGPGGRGARMFGAEGFVTLAQMRERALARFDRADADHDGTLTAAERRETRGHRRGGGGRRRG